MNYDLYGFTGLTLQANGNFIFAQVTVIKGRQSKRQLKFSEMVFDVLEQYKMIFIARNKYKRKNKTDAR